MKPVRKCAIPGCDSMARRRDWCHRHYLRLLRHGDPLGGGGDRNTRTKFLHEVAVPYSGDDCLIWPFPRRKSGYAVARDPSSRKDGLASRIVCQIVHGPAPTAKHQAAHNCGNGNKGCVNPRHLQWKTPKENAADRVLHGTHLRGERQTNSKLTAEQVKEIRALRGTESRAELARRYGIHPDSVSALQRGAYWSWLPL